MFFNNFVNRVVTIYLAMIYSHRQSSKKPISVKESNNFTIDLKLIDEKQRKFVAFGGLQRENMQ